MCFYQASAQINPITPNSYHTPISYSGFQLPTATDVAFSGTKTIQAIVATTPTPTLFWDDGQGNKGSVNIATITQFNLAANIGIYLDDIALINNDNGVVYAYITCRVLLSNNTTEIRLLTFDWSNTLGFQPTPNPTLKDTRPTTVDPFDRVRLKIKASFWPGYGNATNAELAFTYSKNGAVYGAWGNINFTDGSLFNYSSPTYLMNGTMPVVSSHTHISNFHFIFGAKNGTAVNIMANAGSDAFVIRNVYNSNLEIRSIDIDATLVGDNFIVAINELDHANKKSNVTVLHYYFGAINTFNLNAELEIQCNNNLNYKYTGFPKVRTIYADPVHGYYRFEAVWQQVFCNTGNNCTIQAISKRFGAHYWNPIIMFNNNQFIYINSDLSKNSVYPSISYKYKTPSVNNTDAKNVHYSFETLDKITNANGQVGYKRSAAQYYGTFYPNGGNNDYELKVNAPEFGSDIDNEIKINPTKISIFPNPAKNQIFIKATDNITKLELISVQGRVFSTSYSIAAKQQNFDVSKLTNGLYIVRFYSGNKLLTSEKLIINH